MSEREETIDCKKHGPGQERHAYHPRLGLWMCKRCFDEQLDRFLKTHIGRGGT